MNTPQYALVLTGLGILITLAGAALGFIVRTAVKWTRVEDRLERLAENMSKLVQDKDAIHKEMLGQMRDDRRATDRRLRYLEENVWRNPQG